MVIPRGMKEQETADLGFPNVTPGHTIPCGMAIGSTGTTEISVLLGFFSFLFFLQPKYLNLCELNVHML